MNKKSVLLISLILFIVVGVLLYVFRNELIHESYFYTIDHQKEVTTYKEIDAIFSSLPTKAYIELDQNYLSKTKSSKFKYKRLLKRKEYYIIHRRDLYTKIAGDVQIKDLLPQKDTYFKKCLNDNEEIYWLMDKRVVYKLLDLQIALKKEGYDPKGFTVRNGHRYPAYNEKVGGASVSRHILGEAIDLTIGDIDGNGRYEEKKDKKIVLELLDKKIIRNEGGVGLYPNSSSVHFDVRGRKARWKSY